MEDVRLSERRNGENENFSTRPTPVFGLPTSPFTNISS